MYLAIISLITGLAISAVAIYYSVVGLTAIFAAAAIPIMVMGVALEVAKLVATVWLKQNWKIAPSLIKVYLVSAVGILMFITSMGIFGFLSKAHMDQTLVSGDVQNKIAIYDEKIKIARENIDANRKALKQMDEAVDQVMARSSDEKGADKAVAIRRSQQKERGRLLSEIEAEQKKIVQLNEDRAPIAAEVRKVEAEVGPIKYIAAFVYGDNPDANLLERAVTWVIVIIVFVFDPLAVVLLLAAQYSFARAGVGPQDEDVEESDVKLTLAQRFANKILGIRQYFADSADTIKNGFNSKLDRHMVDDTILAPVVAAVTEPEKKEEGVQNIVEENTVTADNTMPLDEMKDKLKLFVNKVYPMQFTSGPASISGFTVPKIDSAIIDTKLPIQKGNFKNLELPVEEIKEDMRDEYDFSNGVRGPVIEEEVELPFNVSVDDWNKLIAEAEKAVETEFNYPDKPVRGQRFNITIDGQERKTIYNGETWINADESSQDAVKALDEEYSKYKLLPELRNHSGYVQNEEQGESTLWKKVHEGLSQEDYQTKAQENLKKENDDGKDNTNKPA